MAKKKDIYVDTDNAAYSRFGISSRMIIEALVREGLTANKACHALAIFLESIVTDTQQLKYIKGLIADEE